MARVVGHRHTQQLIGIALTQLEKIGRAPWRGEELPVHIHIHIIHAAAWMARVDIALVEGEVLGVVAKPGIDQPDVVVAPQAPSVASPRRERGDGDAQTLAGLAAGAAGAVDVFAAATEPGRQQLIVERGCAIEPRVHHIKARHPVVEIGTGLETAVKKPDGSIGCRFCHPSHASRSSARISSDQGPGWVEAR